MPWNNTLSRWYLVQVFWYQIQHQRSWIGHKRIVFMLDEWEVWVMYVIIPYCLKFIVCWFKISCGPYVINTLTRLPIFEWYRIWLVVKNKPHNDTCYNEMGVCAHNKDTTPCPKLYRCWKIYVIVHKQEFFFFLLILMNFTSWLPFWNLKQQSLRFAIANWIRRFPIRTL